VRFGLAAVGILVEERDEFFLGIDMVKSLHGSSKVVSDCCTEKLRKR
jgi:hypothetical protein